MAGPLIIESERELDGWSVLLPKRDRESERDAGLLSYGRRQVQYCSLRLWLPELTLQTRMAMAKHL